MKLEGIRVLDLSTFLPGPHMSMTLADHGADVIMVESANGTGEPTREIGYRTRDGVSVWFRNIARGKRSLKINLKDEGALDLFYELVRSADVFVEAFRPGVVKRLGIDYERLRDVNPRLVYCSISAFGQHGPLRDRPAHDLAIQALAGTMALGLGLEDGKPCSPNMPSADSISSLMAANAILMSLFRRNATGEGDYIDMSMYDALLAWTPNVTGPVFAEDRHPEPKAMRSFGGAGMNSIYETSDGGFIVIGGSEVKFAHNLLSALDRIDLLHYARLEPGPAQAPLKTFFRETFVEKPLAHWEHFLAQVDCCWAPVRTLKDAFADAHAEHRGMLLKDEAGNTHIGMPIKFANEPGQPQLELPEYGQHSVEIARQLGISEATIEALKERDAI